jgi:hypothetical protein
MNPAFRASLAMGLIALSSSRVADAVPACPPREEVYAHVREQFRIYGPQSATHEYFGFIYLHGSEIGSAVIRSGECRNPDRCIIKVAAALSLIPSRSAVLGEWHTHPHNGDRGLSEEDVRGAHNNRHLRCYFAYYSSSIGEIYAWNPQDTSVPTAMHSRVLIGKYVARHARTG